MNSKQIRVLNIIGLSFIGMLLGVLVAKVIMVKKVKAELSQTGCQGIEQFDNQSFREAKNNIERLYTTYTEDINNPEELIHKGGDCKSVSKALMCLCQRRGKECHYKAGIVDIQFKRPFLIGHFEVIRKINK